MFNLKIFLSILLVTAALGQSNTCPGFFAGDLLQTGTLPLTQANMHSSEVNPVALLNTTTSPPSILMSLTQEWRFLSVIFSLFSHLQHRRIQSSRPIWFQLLSRRIPAWQLKSGGVPPFHRRNQHLEFNSDILCDFGSK